MSLATRQPQDLARLVDPVHRRLERDVDGLGEGFPNGEAGAVTPLIDEGFIDPLGDMGGSTKERDRSRHPTPSRPARMPGPRGFIQPRLGQGSDLAHTGH